MGLVHLLPCSSHLCMWLHSRGVSARQSLRYRGSRGPQSQSSAIMWPVKACEQFCLFFSCGRKRKWPMRGRSEIPLVVGAIGWDPDSPRNKWADCIFRQQLPSKKTYGGEREIGNSEMREIEKKRDRKRRGKGERDGMMQRCFPSPSLFMSSGLYFMPNSFIYWFFSTEREGRRRKRGVRTSEWERE